MEKILGSITDEEMHQIHRLYMRINALDELTLIVSESDTVFRKSIEEDKTKTSKLYDQWWIDTKEKYNWKVNPTDHWRVDFKTCKVYIFNN